MANINHYFTDIFGAVDEYNYDAKSPQTPGGVEDTHHLKTKEMGDHLLAQDIKFDLESGELEMTYEYAGRNLRETRIYQWHGFDHYSDTDFYNDALRRFGGFEKKINHELNGNSSSNKFVTKAGDDYANGRAGDDHMELGMGNNVYIGGEDLDHCKLEDGSVFLSTEEKNGEKWLVFKGPDGGTNRIHESSEKIWYQNEYANWQDLWDVNHPPAEREIIKGNRKRNRLRGTDKDETFIGGARRDDLICGGGADYVVLNKGGRLGRKKHADRIYDMNRKEGDKLQIDSSKFGYEDADIKIVKTNRQYKNAKKSEVEFIYNRKTGGLFHNDNGSSKGFGDKGGLICKILGDRGIRKLGSDNFEFI